MKKIEITIILFAITFVQDFCAQNISWSNTDVFSNTIITIQTTNNQQARFNNALKYFSNTHATTKQLQDACFYLNNDQEKYKLCFAAYPNIIDKNNFINIYDSFSSFSNAIKLFRDTEAKDELLTFQNNQKLNVEKDENNKFDLLIDKGDMFLTVNKFEDAIKTYQQAMELKPENTLPNIKIKDAVKWQSEFSKINNEKKENNIRHESLIQQGDHLLAYNLFNEAIVSYEKAMPLKAGDQTAYNRIKEVSRRMEESKKEQEKVEEIEIVEVIDVPCITEESKFLHIMNTVESKSFSDDKKEMAKNQISKNCLSIDQFKKMINVFSMDSDKLEMLKYMYKYSENPEKMYQLREQLSFSNTKEKFDEFLIDRE